MTAPHFLIAVRELGIRIGGPTSVRREGIADIARAKNFQEAESKALARFAKKWKTNVVCLQVTEARLAVRPEPEVLYDSAKADKVNAAYSLAFARLHIPTTYAFDATAPTFRSLA